MERVNVSFGAEPEWKSCGRCGEQTSMSPCWECLCKEREATARQEASADAGRTIPASHAECALRTPTLAKWVRSTDAHRDAKRILASRRAVIVGPAGSGKTTLAVACMRERLQFARFVAARELGLARLQHSAGGGESPTVVQCVRAPILVLDDLGQEAAIATNAVPDVIQERHAKGLVTWVTTGLTSREVASRYGDGIARRVYEYASIIALGAET